MTQSQKNGTTDLDTVIFRKLKSSGLIIAVWPYVSPCPGNCRYQYLFGLNSLETSNCPYGWLIKNSVAAAAGEYEQIHHTLQLMGYWYSVDTRRYASHYSQRSY